MIWSSRQGRRRILLIWLSYSMSKVLIQKKEDNSSRYLGSHFKCQPMIGFLCITQEDSFKHIRNSNSWNWTAHVKYTLTQKKPLTNQVHGESSSFKFNYSSGVGMMLYLADLIFLHDLHYHVSASGRYMFPFSWTCWWNVTIFHDSCWFLKNVCQFMTSDKFLWPSCMSTACCLQQLMTIRCHF